MDDANVVPTSVVVVEVRPGRRLVLRRPDGSTVAVTDPRGKEAWQPGDQAVLEEKLVRGRWVVHDVQRLYWPVLAETVVARQGNTLHSDRGSPIELESSTMPRSDRDGHFVATPLNTIRPAEVVGGLTYLDPKTGGRIAAVVGVRRS
jgi:hypothetical protein